jgi:hypothetical protein
MSFNLDFNVGVLRDRIKEECQVQKETTAVQNKELLRDIEATFLNLENLIKAVTPRSTHLLEQLKIGKEAIQTLTTSEILEQGSYCENLKTIKKCLKVVIQNSSLLQDNTIGLNQTDLQQKIVLFLERELKKCTHEEEKKNRQEAIDYFKNSRGECVGLSTLWCYARRLEDEKNKTQKAKDDLAFFNTCHRKLLSWDEKSEFNGEEIADLERFIGNVRTFQIPSFLMFKQSKKLQLDLSITLDDTKRGQPLVCFEKDNFMCSKKMLDTRLKEIIQPQTLIFLGATKNGSGHQMALYKNKEDGKVYFYNPNARHGWANVQYGEKEIENLEELIDAFWEGSDPSSFLLFGGFDPVDRALRNVTIEVYRFSEDQQYDYPKENNFNLTAEEVLTVFKDFPFIPKFASRKEVQSFIKSLDKHQALELIKREEVSLELKKDLKALLIEEKNQLTKRILQQVTKRSVDRDPLQVKQLTDEAIALQDMLSLENILLVLALNPGDTPLAKKLLNAALDKGDMKYGFAISIAIWANINHNTLETAKMILKILGDKFEIAPSYEQILEFKNVELAQFMEDHFADYYLDRFGNSKLTFLPQLIAVQLQKERKEKLCKKILQEVIKDSVERDPLQVKQLTDEAIALQEMLSLENILLVLALNPGNTPLAKKLLNVPLDKGDMQYGFAISIAIWANINQNTLETAKMILKILGDKFEIAPSYEQILEFKNVELAQFMEDHFADYYLDRFGNSKLTFLSRLIAAQLQRERKEKLCEKIPKEVTKRSVDRDPIQVKQLTDEAIALQDMLSLENILLVLALNPGDTPLAKKLLNAALDKGDMKYGFAISIAIWANINHNTLETAKMILKILGDKFEIAPSYEQILEFKNVELAQFMEDHFADYYLDRFGNSKLTFLPQLIAVQLQKERKEKLCKKILQEVIKDSVERDPLQVKQLTDEAIALQEMLSLENILLVLALNPGNTPLAKKLLNVPLDKGDMQYGFAISIAIWANINQNTLETAKMILKILGDKFEIAPSYEQILEFKNVELAQFMEDHFADYYLDRFGNSKLTFLPRLMESKITPV